MIFSVPDTNNYPVVQQNIGVKFRAYDEAEFEFACRLRGLSNPEEMSKFRERFEAVGQWRDHYLDYVIDVDGKPIGQVQVRHCDKTMPEGALEFGIEIAPEYQGKGYGTQAIIEITRHMFAQGHHRIAGSTDVENIAMKKAFERAGWKFEGVLRALFVEDGIPHDYLSYSCTKFDLA